MSAESAASRTLSMGSPISAISVSTAPSALAARAAYMRTCQVGCATNSGRALVASAGCVRASETSACAGACQARGCLDSVLTMAASSDGPSATGHPAPN